MTTRKQIAIYTNISKQIEFKDRLNAILERPESSIAVCYLQQSTADKFCLFIIPKTPKYDFTTITFDFTHYFSDSPSPCPEFYERYMGYGLSKEDIDSLSHLLDEFTFKNRYEGAFFASKFFEPQLNLKNNKSILFKCIPDDLYNRYLIDGRYVERYYSVVTADQLVRLFKNEKDLDFNKTLVKCKTSTLSTHVKIEHCYADITQVRRDSDPVEQYIVEHYQDFETWGGYIKTIFKLDDGLQEVDIKSFTDTI